MSAQGQLAGKARVKLSLDDDDLQKGLKESQRRLRNFGSSLRAIGKDMMIAGGLITAPFALATKQFASTGDALNKMSARTGASVEMLSELSFAAQQSGTEIEAVEKSMLRLQKNTRDLERGLSTSVDAFKSVGMSAKDIEGLTPDQLFEKVSNAIALIEDPTRKAALAMELFGKSGAKIIPLIDNMQVLRDEAKRLGLTISTEQAQSAADLTDAFGRLSSAIKVLSFTIGSSFSNVLQKILKYLLSVSKNVIDFVNSNKELIVTVAKIGAGLLAIGGTLISVGFGVSALSFAVSGLGAVLTVVVGSLNLVLAGLAALITPIGFVVGSTVALGLAFAHSAGYIDDAIDFISNKILEMKKYFEGTFKAIRELLSRGDITGAAKVLFAQLQVEFIRGTNYLHEIWSVFSTSAISLFETIKTNAVDVADTIYVSFKNAMDSLYGVILKAASFISETFWKAADGVIDAFASILDKISSSGYALNIIDDKELVKLDIAIKKLQSAGSGFTKNQIDKSAELYGQEIDKIDGRKNARDEELNKRTIGRFTELEKEKEKQNQNFNQTLIDSMKRLNSAKENLDKVIEDTASEADSIQSNSVVKKAVDALASSEAVSDTITARGQFGGQAIARTFGNGSGVNKVEKYTEETAKATKETLKYLKSKDVLAFT